MRIKEIKVKSILTRSRIPGVLYCLNPYTGCQHGCKYCYARFMKKFTGHLEKWGDFVDVKINAPAVLEKQLKTAKKEFISISTVTDPYQPLERIYQITRKCLEVLLKYQFPVSILTKSPLVLRDIDLLSQFHDSEVGVTITTGNDAIRKIFEPRAPSINQRIEILKGFHNQGVKTYAFIGPILPMNAENLAEKLVPLIDMVIIDKLNYPSLVKNIYQNHGLEYALKPEYFQEVRYKLEEIFRKNEIKIWE